MRGSTHMSQTDFAVLSPKWMDLFIKTLMHPSEGDTPHRSTNPGVPQDRPPQRQTSSYDTSNWVDEGLLMKSQPNSDSSVEHRPDEKRTAAGLKIDNEFQVRLRNWWARTWRRRRGDAEAGNVPRDARGRPLFGLKTGLRARRRGLHMWPRKEDVDKRLERRDEREMEWSGGEHEQWPRPTVR